MAFCWQKSQFEKKNLSAIVLRKACAYSPIELCPLLMGVVGLVRKKKPLLRVLYSYFDFWLFLQYRGSIQLLYLFSWCTINTPILGTLTPSQ